jgi:hypothetical protein
MIHFYEAGLQIPLREHTTDTRDFLRTQNVKWSAGAFKRVGTAANLTDSIVLNIVEIVCKKNALMEAFYAGGF